MYIDVIIYEYRETQANTREKISYNFSYITLLGGALYFAA